MNQEFFVRLPNCRHPYGPYSCREEDDIANYLLELSNAQEARVHGTPFRVVLPRNLSAHIQVITYPSSTSYSHVEPEPVMVYGIECGPQERLSEVEIRNRLRTTYEDDVFGERCFCVYSELTQSSDEVDSCQRSGKYGRGAIFIAKHYVYNSDSNSPSSGCVVPRIIDPPTNLPLRHENSESLSKMGPIATNSDPHSTRPFVMSNQNLVLPASPSNNDNMRKVLTQMDAPNQTLVADLPHLEQKSPLQNLGDLAGSTALQSVLVTPSGEQPELGGPVPCKDKSPVIVISVTDEGEKVVEKHTKEEIVKPQSESSVGVSSPKSTADSLFNPLLLLRRQRSLSGCEDMVAPMLQKSHIGMVTGRTISLPPNKQLSKSTENLCTGSSTGLSRTQSDPLTLVHGNKDDPKLLLNCNAAQGSSDTSSCVAEVQPPKMRRRSMSDLGVQRQNSGGDLNESVIIKVGVPKCLLAHNVGPNKSRSCLASTIHEQDSENDSELSKHAMKTGMCVTQRQCVGEARIETPVKARRPLLRLGSQNETSCLDNEESNREHCDLEQENEKQHSLEEEEEEEEEVVERNEEQLQPRGMHSESVLPTRAVRQQVHIMEHVYNGKCVLGDDCPRLPSAESLRQMYDIIQDHRNGVLSAPFTQLLMSYIIAHCTKCRDSGCKVPHMAVGCPQPGMSESLGSSCGSISTTSSQPSYQPMVQRPQQPSVSFDLIAANHSTSDDIREFYQRQGPGQCAESKYLPGQRGANYTDDPLAPVGSGFPPTNGTPPDDVNPMVYAPLDYRPRPNGLLGVGPGQAMAPVAATTNEKGLTPWQSTGFQLHNVFCGQLTDSLHSPIQQVSDFDHAGGLNRHQACYIQPTRKVNNYIQDCAPFSPSKLPNVLEEGFPLGRKYSNIDEGIFIYCSKKLTNDTGFSLGAKGHPPHQEKAHVLGSGGNGQVYGYFQNGREFAIKRTAYRQAELQAWLRLDHPNVLPLLGVMWGGHNSHRGHYCYQFMSKMTSDLRFIMRSVGDLCTLIRSESSSHWENVLRPNVCHVLRSVLSGVKYLHDMGIQHYDLKASNILINKPSSCQCTNIFCCDCPSESKCEIRITDFDSVKTFAPGRCAASVPDVECVPKPSDVKVLGTPYYRAPEQFKLQKYSAGVVQRTTWSQQQYSVEGLEGPWCDMWAVGVIITQLCLGKQMTEEKERVCRTLVTTPTMLPSTTTPTPEVEGFVALERLSTLREKCLSCHQLVPLEKIATLCLMPDFKKRITAEKLLQNDFLQ